MFADACLDSDSANKNVISKMEEKRMDADACVYADGSIVIDMGLVCGIIVKLKVHLLPSVLAPMEMPTI